MSVYFLPALISLVFKLFILVLVLRGGKISGLFLSLILIFACHNAIELIGYIQFSNNQAIELMFRSYYVISTFLITFILLHGLAISERNSNLTTFVLIAITMSVSVLMLFTDSIIAGHYSIGYSVTAIQGPFYLAFVLYLVAKLLANVVTLLQGYLRAKSTLGSIRCAYSLVALAPVMIVVVTAIILKMTNSGINAAGIFPIATTLFLLLIVKGESQHKLMDIRRFLPFSAERKAATDVIQIMDEYTSRNNSGADSFKALRNSIEKKIIFYTLHRCDYNVSKAAEMMGFESRSTLYSMMNRLGINHNERN